MAVKIAPIRKAVNGSIAAAVTTAFAIFSADNFDFHQVTVSQWQSVAVTVAGVAWAVYGSSNKDKAPAAASADAATPAADASAPVDVAEPPAIAEDVLNAIAADWAAATTPAETPAVEVPASPSV